MGTWSANIDGSDAFQNVYQRFFELYNKGQSPVAVSEQVLREFAEEFDDYDDKSNSLFGLALAQWETKSLNINVLNQVREVIENGSDIESWQAPEGVNSNLLNKRQKVLANFLSKISVEKAKPKRRIREKFEFTTIEIAKVTAPDNQKVFEVAEQYINGVYQQTGSSIMWGNGGGSVFYFIEQGKTIKAEWNGNQTLRIVHDKGITFTLQNHKFYYCGDEGVIIYEPV